MLQFISPAISGTCFLFDAPRTQDLLVFFPLSGEHVRFGAKDEDILTDCTCCGAAQVSKLRERNRTIKHPSEDNVASCLGFLAFAAQQLAPR